MKKALQLASVASMIDQFTMPNINLLQSLGYKVDVIADFTNPGNISLERSKELIERLEMMDVCVIDVAIPRGLNPKAVISAYKKVRNVIKREHYDLVHCHSPIGGALARLAAKRERKNRMIVIYTAHGFHFYNGAPLMNWFVFYPIEWWLSKYTDILITINKEDYRRAKSRFKAKRTEYVPGIGVDYERFRTSKHRSEIRKELGVSDTDIMLLSVGELNSNKNHEIVIRALALMDEKPYYVIVGKGKKQKELNDLVFDLGLQNRVKLVGFRQDVVDFYGAADLFVFPSHREGLPVALMEAMASGLPCVVSKIRGNVDLIEDEELMFNADSVEEERVAICKGINVDRESVGRKNAEIIKQNFSIETVNRRMKKIYQGIFFLEGTEEVI